MKSLISIVEHYRKLIIENIDQTQYSYIFVPRKNILIRLLTRYGFELKISTSQDFVYPNKYSYIDSWFSLDRGWLKKETSEICYYTRKVGMPGCNRNFPASSRKYSDGSYRDFPKLIKQYNIFVLTVRGANL